jgi:hypothetical protein
MIVSFVTMLNYQNLETDIGIILTQEQTLMELVLFLHVCVCVCVCVCLCSSAKFDFMLRFIYAFFFVVLGVDLRVMCLLGKYSTS